MFFCLFLGVLADVGINAAALADVGCHKLRLTNFGSSLAPPQPTNYQDP